MEHFFQGTVPLKHWYINPMKKKSEKYKSSLILRQLTITLMEHFRQGNLSLK